MPFTAKNLVISFLAIVASFQLYLFPPVFAAETEIVSTMELMHAYAAVDGIRVVPAEGIPAKIYTEDYSPSQVLEIIRPDQGPISVGRLATSCACLRASLPKQTFAQGERAFIEVRNAKPTQPNGATYAIFVQLTSPHKLALQYDYFAKSTRKPGDPVPAEAQPASEPAPAPVEVSPQADAPVAVNAGTHKNPRIKYEDIAPYAPKSGGSAE